MKFSVSLLLTAVLSFSLCLVLPWWSIAIAAFLVALLIPQKPLKSFACAFAAVLLLWTGLSFWLSVNNGHILAKKISLLILNVENPLVLILITGLIGGLVAGFASLTGSLLRTRKQYRDAIL